MAWAGYWHSAATLNFLRGYAANGDHTPVQSIEATGLEHGPAGKAKHGIRDIRRLGEVILKVLEQLARVVPESFSKSNNNM